MEKGSKSEMKQHAYTAAKLEGMDELRRTNATRSKPLRTTKECLETILRKSVC